MFASNKKRTHLLFSGIEIGTLEDFNKYVPYFSCKRDEIPFLVYRDICLSFVFNSGDELVEIIEHEEDGKTTFGKDELPFDLSYEEIRPNSIHYLIDSVNHSASNLGGNSTLNPYLDTPIELNYFGKFSKAHLKNLPFNELEIFVPSLDIPHPIYFDYSKAGSIRLIRKNLEIIRPEKVNFTEEIYFDMLPITKVKEKVMITFDDWNFGNTGIPFFVQHIEIPTCPISGNNMDFLCQLNLDEIGVGFGVLFLFIEPKSKTLSCFVQNT